MAHVGTARSAAALFLVSLGLWPLPAQAVSPEPDDPLVFEANRGQADSPAAFLARAYGYQALVGASGVTLRLPGDQSVEMVFVDAAPAASLAGAGALPERVHSLAAESITNVPTFTGVVRSDPYPGIALAYRGAGRRLAIELTLAPGVDPAALRLGVRGARAVRLDRATGALVAVVAGGEIRFAIEDNTASFVMRGDNEPGLVPTSPDGETARSIRIVATVPAPQRQDVSLDAPRVATDAQGNAYVTGRHQRFAGDLTDAFVAKIAPDGRTRLFTTYFEAGSSGMPLAVAADRAGCAVVAGGNFLAKLTADGSAFLFSRSLGATGDEEPRAIALDASGSVWVTGRVLSRFASDGSEMEIPESIAASAIAIDADGSVYLAGSSRSGANFVAKLDARVGALRYTTFLPAAGGETVTDLAIEPAGSLRVAGNTPSGRFTATLDPSDGALQREDRFPGAGTGDAAGLATDDTGSWLAGGGALALRLDRGGRVTDRFHADRSDGEAAITGMASAGNGTAFVTGIASGKSPSRFLALATSPTGAAIFAGRVPSPPEAPAAAGCPGTIQFTNGGGTGLWQTPANWNAGHVPLSTDDVCIPAGFNVVLSTGPQSVNSVFVAATSSLTVSVSFTLAAASQFDGGFTLQGGTLAAAGITCNGAFTWTSGTITGAATLFANGGTAISGSATHDLSSGRTLDVSGTTTWTGTGSIRVSASASITNHGTWDCQSDASILDIGSAGAFTNLAGATFKKSAGAGTTAVSVPFANAGTTSVLSGTLRLTDGGTHSGTFTGSAGTTLTFGGGTHTLSTGGSVNASTVVFAAGTVNVEGTYAATAGTTISGAVANFNPAGTVTSIGSALVVSTGTANFVSGETIAPATLSLSLGTLQGSDTVTISGLFSWSGGTMTGAATTNANGGIAISGPATHDISSGRTLDVSGTTTWTGTGSIRSSASASITNHGTWDCQGDASILNIGAAGAFTNLAGATFKKSAGSGTTTVSVPFANAGTTSVLSGTLGLTGGGTHSGSFTGSAGTTLSFGGGTHTLSTGGSVNASTVVLAAGTVNVEGTYAATAGTTISGATANFNPAGTVTSIGSALIVSTGTANFVSGEVIAPTTLTLSLGTLQGSDTVTISGLFSWSGGTMTGAATTNANGGIAISGPATHDISSGRTLDVSGTTTWTGTGSIRSSASASITNHGTWDCQGDASILNIGAAGAFTNLAGATFKKSVATGLTTVSVPFANAGTASVLSGTMSLTGGGTHSGSFTGSAGTTLSFGGGTHTLSTGGSVNASTVVFAAGTVNVEGTYAATAGTTISGTTANFNPAGTVTSIGSALIVSTGTANFVSGETIAPTTLTLSGGTLQGSDTVTVSGLFSWSGGTMTGSATTNANGGISLSTASIHDLTGSRLLNVSGTTTWTGTGAIRVSGGASITNNGTWDCQGDASILDIGSAGAFTNLVGATFRKSVATGITTVSVPFANAGTTSVLSGTLSLTGGGTHSGSFTGSVGTTLSFGGGTHTLGTGGSVNASTVVFAGGTVNVEGTYAATAGTTISGAVANFNPAATVTSVGSVLTISNGTANFSSGEPISASTMSFASGTRQGTDTVTISGLTTWTGGTMTGPGTTNVNGGIDLSGASSRDLTGAHTLNTAGTTTWSGSGAVRMGTGGSIANSGTWDCQGGGMIVELGSSGGFTNAASGIFKKSAGTTTSMQSPFVNAGAVQALASTLQFSAGYTQTAGSTTTSGGAIGSNTPLNIQAGTLTGVGTSATSVVNAGHAVPGLPIGALTLSGNYTQSPAGSFDVQLGGRIAGTEHDQMNLIGTGVASFAGTLNVSLANGFVPVGGDSFTLMNYASSTGSFSASSLPPLAQGCWRTFYNPTSLELQLWTVAPEATGVAAAADKSTISWNPLPPAAGPTPTYDLMRGALRQFPVGGMPGETCIASTVSTTNAADPTVPALGSGFYYLVRGSNVCGVGGYGSASNGTPRTPTTCP